MATWQRRLQGLLREHGRDRTIDYYALATLGNTKPLQPRVRTVVHRGFVQGSSPECDWLLTTTDSRSAKFQEINALPSVELAWYIAPAQAQFRIRATAYLVSQSAHGTLSVPDALHGASMDWGAERRRAWQLLSDALKDTFLGHASGKPLEKEMSASDVVQIDGIPMSFALVVLVPHYVDLVELAQAQRTIFSEENGVWSSQDVAL